MRNGWRNLSRMARWKKLCSEQKHLEEAALRTRMYGRRLKNQINFLTFGLMNKYEREARVYPAIAGNFVLITLISIIIYNNYITEYFCLEKIWGMVSAFTPTALLFGSIAFFCRQLFADTSKRIFQYKFFEQDETEMPTTQMLLWTSPCRLSSQQIIIIRNQLQKDFGIRLLSKNEEENDLLEAKRTIVDAVGKMREVTRQNQNLQRYNRKYVFCRNFLGASVYSILLLIVLLICNYIVSWGMGMYTVIAIIAQIFLSAGVYLGWKTNGVDYAKALFNAYLTRNHK